MLIQIFGCAAIVLWLVVSLGMLGVAWPKVFRSRKERADRKWAAQRVEEQLKKKCCEKCRGQEYRLIQSSTPTYMECVCADGTVESLRKEKF